MEQPVATEPTTPAIEEPLVTGLTLPRGGAHDEGDLSDEGLWSVAAMSANPARARAEAAGDAPSNVTRDPPTVAEQAMAPTMSIVEARLGQPVRAQQRPKRAPLQAATAEVEEITWEPSPPP